MSHDEIQIIKLRLDEIHKDAFRDRQEVKKELAAYHEKADLRMDKLETLMRQQVEQTRPIITLWNAADYMSKFTVKTAKVFAWFLGIMSVIIGIILGITEIFKKK